ncbi:MAG: T9SS type A sorting domain-containing protein, partial [Bacteroidota bacterium]
AQILQTMKKYILLFLFTSSAAFVMAQGSLTVTTSQTNASVCTAPCNGTATVSNVTGGTPPYSYYWGTSPAQQTQTATGLCPGTYTVGVYDSTSPIPSYGSAQVTITCIQGIEEYLLNNYVEVYPNPASSVITVSVSYPNGGEVREAAIINAIGEKVISKSFSSSVKFSGTVDVSSLAAGTYFIELKDAKNMYRTKFVKQ